MASAPAALRTDAILQQARTVIEAELRAVQGLLAVLDGGFSAATERMLGCTGHVVVTGMGKSGIVGQKISATLASTGTPSLYLHAAEAVHGDLGRITAADVVLALSNSGESEEVMRLVRPVRDLGACLIALVGDADSRLARHADIVIGIGDVAEACPMGLVPTASTTAMMVVGDALAVALYSLRGFGPEAYARFHPGGALGRQFLRVEEVMRKGAENPIVRIDANIAEVLEAMTATPGRPGATSIVDATGKLVGFFTDGDLRRLFGRSGFDAHTPVGDVMHRGPKVVHPDQLVVEAARIMREHQIDQVPVVDVSGCPVGLLDVQDLLSARIF